MSTFGGTRCPLGADRWRLLGTCAFGRIRVGPAGPFGWNGEGSEAIMKGEGARVSRVELLSPKVDFVFKRIFGTEENKDVLAHFLNSVFEDSGEPLIADVEILNPFLEKEALSDKLAVLDVKARTESGTLINVEVQLWNHQDMENRTLYYWAKLFQSQLKEGDSYYALQKAVTINVVDFRYIETEVRNSFFSFNNYPK